MGKKDDFSVRFFHAVPITGPAQEPIDTAPSPKPLEISFSEKSPVRLNITKNIYITLQEKFS